MVYCVALTGTIASGKSTVGQYFTSYGIDVFNADRISKELCVKNSAAYKQIVAHFGLEIIQQDGELDRKKLRECIFTHAPQRIWLENLLHPLIRARLTECVDLSISPYCIVEIPLLINKDLYPYLNRILLVLAAEDMQIERIMARDNCRKEQALAILAAQPDINVYKSIADDVLFNESSLAKLEKETHLLHERYLDNSMNIFD